MSQAAAELTLHRTVDDYAAFQKQAGGEVTARNLAYRFLYWGSAVLAAAVALVTVYLAVGGQGRSLDLWQFVLLVLAFFGAWSLMNWLIAPLIRRRTYPRLDIFCSPARLTVTDSALQMSGRGYNNSYDWSVVTDIVETPRHIFIRIDGISSVVVPLRDVADAAQRAAFLDSVRAHIAAAHPA
jgi:hypothetical protein